MSNYNDFYPPLKWAGGKRQLLALIEENMPEEDFDVYVEPFLGAGALLFDLKAKNAIVNDYNKELINVYMSIKWHPKKLVELLTHHSNAHCKEHYYQVRDLDRTDSYKQLNNIEKAARTIYLNRTCFNGLYRVNRNGHFNTPIGKYVNPRIVDKDNIYAISRFLRNNNVKLYCKDYTNILDMIVNEELNCFCYLDPPYYPISETSSFTDYTRIGFGEREQIQLKEKCDLLNNSGVKFLQSNSDCEFIRNLYCDYNIITVPAKRNINANGNNRTGTEVLISNY